MEGPEETQRNSRTQNYNQIGRVSDEKTKSAAYVIYL